MSLIITAKPNPQPATITDFFERRGLPEVILLDAKEIDTIAATHSITEVETPLVRIRNCTQQKLGICLQAKPKSPGSGRLSNQRVSLWVGNKQVIQRISLPSYHKGKLTYVFILERKKPDKEGRLFKHEIGIGRDSSKPDRLYIPDFFSFGTKNPLLKTFRILEQDEKEKKESESEEKEPSASLIRSPKPLRRLDPKVASILQDFTELSERMDWQAGYPIIVDAGNKGKNPVACYVNEISSKIGIMVDRQNEDLKLWIRVGDQSFESHAIPEIEAHEQVRFVFRENEQRDETIPGPILVLCRIEERDHPNSYKETASRPLNLYTYVTNPND